MVPGEIISCPSSKHLHAIHIVFLDCDDQERVQRLKPRGEGGASQDTLNWSAWLRMHCADPQWESRVVKAGCAAIMNHSQWEQMQAWYPEVSIYTVDTTTLTIDEVSQQIAQIGQKIKAASYGSADH